MLSGGRAYIAPIVVAIGSNLPSISHGGPLANCQAAVDAIEQAGITIVRLSSWYESAPQPTSDQPWFVNGVVEVDTDLSPAALLGELHRIEEDFGRVRQRKNEARVIDLDLIAFRDRVSPIPAQPVLPHPRLAERAFVLIPLRDIAPNWRHPATGGGIDDLIQALPAGGTIRRLS